MLIPDEQILAIKKWVEVAALKKAQIDDPGTCGKRHRNGSTLWACTEQAGHPEPCVEPGREWYYPERFPPIPDWEVRQHYITEVPALLSEREEMLKEIAGLRAALGEAARLVHLYTSLTATADTFEALSQGRKE